MLGERRLQTEWLVLERSASWGVREDGEENQKSEEPQLTFSAPHSSAFGGKHFWALFLVYYLRKEKLSRTQAT